MFIEISIDKTLKKALKIPTNQLFKKTNHEHVSFLQINNDQSRKQIYEVEIN